MATQEQYPFLKKYGFNSINDPGAWLVGNLDHAVNVLNENDNYLKDYLLSQLEAQNINAGNMLEPDSNNIKPIDRIKDFTYDELKKYVNSPPPGITTGDLSTYLSVTDNIKADHVAKTEKPPVGARIGRGFYDVVGDLYNQGEGIAFPGARQMLGLLSDEQEQAEQQRLAQYTRAMGDDFDGARLVGQAAPMVVGGTPAMISKLPALGRAGLGLLTGFGAGSSIYAPTQDQQLDAGAMSGIISGGLSAVSPVLGTMFSSMVNPIARRLSRNTNAQRLINEGLLSADQGLPYSLLSGNSQIGTDVAKNVTSRAAGLLDEGKNLDTDDYKALARSEAGKEFGYEGGAAATRGQAYQDPQTITEEIRLSKLDGGEEMFNRFDEQAEIPLKVIKQIIEPYKNKPTNKTNIGKNIVADINTVSKEMQNKVSAAYKAIPNTAVFNPETLARNLASELSEMEDHITNAVKTRIKELTDPENERPKTIEEWVKLDKLISKSMGSSNDTSVNLAATNLKRSLMKSLDDIAEETADESIKKLILNAKNTAQNRFKNLDQGKPSGLLDKLLKGKIKDDKIGDSILNASSEEVNSIKNLLTGNLGESFKDLNVNNTFDNVRALYANEFGDILVDGGSTVGGKQFSPTWYRNTVNNMTSRKINMIFPKTEAEKITNYVPVSQMFHGQNPLGRAKPNINYSGSASEAANILTGYVFPALNMAQRLTGTARERMLNQQSTRGLLGDVAQTDFLETPYTGLLSQIPLVNRLQSTTNLYDIGRALPTPIGAAAGTELTD